MRVVGLVDMAFDVRRGMMGWSKRLFGLFVLIRGGLCEI